MVENGSNGLEACFMCFRLGLSEIFFHETNMPLYSVLESQSSHYKHLQADPCVTFS